MLTNPIWEESHKKIINANLRSKYLIPFIIFIYTKQVNYSNISKDDLITFSFYCGKFIFPEIKIQVDEEIKEYQNESTSILDNQMKLYQKISDLEIEKDNLKFDFKELKTDHKNLKSSLEEKYADLSKDFENIKKSLSPSRKRKRDDDETDEENQKKKKKL